MANKREPLNAADVAARFKRLALAAEQLNDASDVLNHSIEEIERAIGLLNAGVQVWWCFDEGVTDVNQPMMRSIGYTRIEKKWVLAVAQQDRSKPHTSAEVWPMRSAPRYLRIMAIDYIPELLDAMDKAIQAMTTKVAGAVNLVEDMTEAVRANREGDTDGNK